MPKVLCAHCGEELMGAVNRCWRCGRTFVAEHNPANLPPIRRRPIPLDLVNQSLEALLTPAEAASGLRALEAELVDDAAMPVSASTAEETQRHHAALVGSAVSPPPGAAAAVLSRATPYYAAPPKPAYPTNAGATGGAIASVVLGVMALVAMRLITPGALLISILGVGMGVWGLRSDRRGVAVVGLLLCCIAMSVSGFLAVVQIYTLFYGYSPFEADLPAVNSVDPATF